MDNTIAMDVTCPNCHHKITENFCGNCGQKKYKRIDRKYITDELQYSLLHTNKGFFYSLKKIIRNPGKTAREFVDGNRVNHYKPILLVFLLSSISAFVSFKLIGLLGIMKASYAEKGINSTVLTDMLSFMATYSSFMMMLSIPIFACFTKFAFWKWGHNYYEHVIMNAFIQAFYSVITLTVLSPILYLVKDDVHLVMTITAASIPLILPFLLIWFFKGFYPERKLKHIVLRVLLMGILVLIIYFLVIIITVIILVISNPEAIMKMKQH